MVFVINNDGKPLMPCSNVIARLLLKQNKARVERVTPFIIKLLYQLKIVYLQKLNLGLDSGSRIIGSAVSDIDGNIQYISQIEVRNDITNRMNRRRNYRQLRRNRKCRYRKCRFLNRKNSRRKLRFSPTINSKINTHLREIKFAEKILPINDLIIENGTFDLHAIRNPSVLNNPILYQKGLKYGFNNTKAFVLHRDNYRCQYCKGKSKDRKLHCHHIIFREQGGSDNPENLIVLCKTCHLALHEGKITLKKSGSRKRGLMHATQMNIIIKQLFKRTNAKETFGFITKTHRQAFNLPKYHFIDAAVISTKGKQPDFKTDKILYKKCIPRGDYQQTRGKRSQQHITTMKICGFRKYDKVRYNGKNYFIKGRMAIGYAILMDIEGRSQQLKPIPKFIKMKRIIARKSWIMTENLILI
ncbi:MAG: HNH endonuclease [Candidatus Helarchaeota archaeon]|nr:HNH endonuclease [Candidatus Helarchaeota archaeon]